MFGLDILGGTLGAGLNVLGGWMANEANEDTNERNLNFQDMMSRTQYQRAVTDMQAAGINPMLAAKVGGNGMASGSSYQSQNIFEGAGSSAVGMARMAAEMESIEASTDKTKAEADMIRNFTGPNIASQTRGNTVSAERAEKLLDKVQYELESAKYGVDVDRTKSREATQRYHMLGNDVADPSTGEPRKRVPSDSLEKLDNPAWLEWRQQRADTMAREGRLPIIPAEVRKALAEALKTEYGLAGAKNESDMQSGDYGDMAPYVKELLKIIMGVRNAVGH